MDGKFDFIAEDTQAGDVFLDFARHGGDFVVGAGEGRKVSTVTEESKELDVIFLDDRVCERVDAHLGGRSGWSGKV